jgi:hypothetical protein
MSEREAKRPPPVTERSLTEEISELVAKCNELQRQLKPLQARLVYLRDVLPSYCSHHWVVEYDLFKNVTSCDRCGFQYA